MRSDIFRIANMTELALPDDAVVIADRVVFHYLPEDVREVAVLVDGGEHLKNLAAVDDLARQVLERRSTRPMTIIAIGGGSVGDAVGFLASVLWRGVDLWHVPTTLLAAVDSAHGGKTAMNLGGRKNQLGTFWPARRVVIVEQLLAELPTSLRIEGMSELVKGLWLGAPDALDLVDAVGVDVLCEGAWDTVGTRLMSLLETAIQVKQQIVEQDPREVRGIRTFLNLGHSAAHAIELLDGLSHGEAVAWGMAAAALLSRERRALSPSDARRWLEQVRPLLGTSPPQPTFLAFEDALRGDKKRIGSRLRSVLLDGPGKPVVVDDVGAAEWFQALQDARKLVFHAPYRVTSGPTDTGATIRLEASKSELNRMLVIGAMRPGKTTIEGTSSADDVLHMQRSIEAFANDEEADAGSGGTTFRFLVALAAAGHKPRRIRISEQLARRPHDPLFDALGSAGGLVEFVKPTVVAVQPCPRGSLEFYVGSDKSSQFASALALMAAAGRKIQLRVSSSLPSRGYFEMTLALLREAGVTVVNDGRTHRLTPTDQLYVPRLMRAAPDASSAAFWRVLQALGANIHIVDNPNPDESLQPDAAIGRYLWPAGATGTMEREMNAAPDLVPVLAAYAAITPAEVVLRGAAHLRLKESNRIEDLCAAMSDVGIRIAPLDDGVHIPAGVQAPRSTGPVRTFGDHRIAMAAAVLAWRAPVDISEPHVVNKSYPAFWDDLRRAGWAFEPQIQV